MRKRTGSTKIALWSGLRFEIRGDKTANNDYGVAYEVFVHQFYERSVSVDGNAKLIVDLGANVGYSVIYFLHRYPMSRIIALEPHASHIQQLERNLLMDDNRHRVELHGKAAGAQTRRMMLTNDGTSSALTEDHSSGVQLVDVIDIFPLLSAKHINVLKMDIEGGEYEILADERFSELEIDAIVMEWHTRGGGINDKQWCQQRLGNLGFLIEDIFTEPSHGMFWATRK